MPAVQIIYEMGACTWRARADEDRNLSPEMATMLTMEMTVVGGAEGAPEPQIREILGVVREMPAGAP